MHLLKRGVTKTATRASRGFVKRTFCTERFLVDVSATDTNYKDPSPPANASINANDKYQTGEKYTMSLMQGFSEEQTRSEQLDATNTATYQTISSHNSQWSLVKQNNLNDSATSNSYFITRDQIKERIERKNQKDLELVLADDTEPKTNIDFISETDLIYKQKYWAAESSMLNQLEICKNYKAQTKSFAEAIHARFGIDLDNENSEDIAALFSQSENVDFNLLKDLCDCTIGFKNTKFYLIIYRTFLASQVSKSKPDKNKCKQATDLFSKKFNCELRKYFYDYLYDFSKLVADYYQLFVVSDLREMTSQYQKLLIGHTRMVLTKTEFVKFIEAFPYCFMINSDKSFLYSNIPNILIKFLNAGTVEEHAGLFMEELYAQGRWEMLAIFIYMIRLSVRHYKSVVSIENRYRNVIEAVEKKLLYMPYIHQLLYANRAKYSSQLDEQLTRNVHERCNSDHELIMVTNMIEQTMHCTFEKDNSKFSGYINERMTALLDTYSQIVESLVAKKEDKMLDIDTLLYVQHFRLLISTFSLTIINPIIKNQFFSMLTRIVNDRYLLPIFFRSLDPYHFDEIILNYAFSSQEYFTVFKPLLTEEVVFTFLEQLSFVQYDAFYDYYERSSPLLTKVMNSFAYFPIYSYTSTSILRSFRKISYRISKTSNYFFEVDILLTVMNFDMIPLEILTTILRHAKADILSYRNLVKLYEYLKDKEPDAELTFQRSLESYSDWYSKNDKAL